MFGMHGKDRKTFVVPLSKYDETLLYGLQGIGQKATSEHSDDLMVVVKEIWIKFAFERLDDNEIDSGNISR